MFLLYISFIYAIYILIYPLQRYKKNPESCPFPTDYFLTSIKNIKNICILQ